jgi:hypothetical protein
MLHLLSKELWCLQDEWHAHILALLAEQERSNQETPEAGHRQEEEGRHHEHDEVFRQVRKTVISTRELKPLCSEPLLPCETII